MLNYSLVCDSVSPHKSTISQLIIFNNRFVIEDIVSQFSRPFFLPTFLILNFSACFLNVLALDLFVPPHVLIIYTVYRFKYRNSTLCYFHRFENIQQSGNVDLS